MVMNFFGRLWTVMEPPPPVGAVSRLQDGTRFCPSCRTSAGLVNVLHLPNGVKRVTHQCGKSWSVIPNETAPAEPAHA